MVTGKEWQQRRLDQILPANVLAKFGPILFAVMFLAIKDNEENDKHDKKYDKDDKTDDKYDKNNDKGARKIIKMIKKNMTKMITMTGWVRISIRFGRLAW